MESNRVNSKISGRTLTLITMYHRDTKTKAGECSEGLDFSLKNKSRLLILILYSIFRLRVPDDGTVTFYREIKVKLGFGVVHCC